VPPAGRAPWLRGQIAAGSAPKPARLASLRRPCGRMGRPPGSEGRRSVVKPERPAPVAERGAPGWPDATGGGGRPAGRGSVPGPWGGLRRARGGIGRGVAGGTDPRHGRSATAWPDRRHAIGFGGRHRCLATVLDMVSRGPPGSIEHAASSVSCERRGYGQPPSRPSPPDGVQAAGHHPGCAVGRTVRGVPAPIAPGWTEGGVLGCAVSHRRGRRRRMGSRLLDTALDVRPAGPSGARSAVRTDHSLSFAINAGGLVRLADGLTA
jgi:hypothetical protein